MAKNIILIITVLVTAFSIYWLVFRITPTKTTTINIKDQKYSLEVASTIAQKAKGLMSRDSLCPNCGMLFVSASPTHQIFWMKNTLIPLDIIFLDSLGKVINIETAVPQPGVPDLELKLYKSTSPSQFVIELNVGDSQKLNLVPGDVISIPSEL